MSSRAARLLTAVLLVLVLIGTLMPGPAKQSLLSHFSPGLHLDKLGHALGFFAMAFFASRSRIPRARPWHLVLFAAGLGSLTELCQNFIPGRTPLVTDVLIDVCGALAGLWLTAPPYRTMRHESA